MWLINRLLASPVSPPVADPVPSDAPGLPDAPMRRLGLKRPARLTRSVAPWQKIGGSLRPRGH